MATITDVAKKVGVAISTVSNVLNGVKYVSPETTKRVLEAVDALGYVANPIAHNMKSARSNMIGVIITNFSRIFFSSVLRKCREIAEEKGFQLMCIDTNDDFNQEKQYVGMMKQHRYDAIILDTVADLDDRAYFTYLKNLSPGGKKTAIICLERDLAEYGIDSVDADNFGGAQKAVGHLISCGCKKIIHIAGTTNSWAAECRARGYCDRIRMEPGAFENIILGDFSPQSGYDAIKQLLASRSARINLPFDGIFAANDQMAVGAIKALQELHIRVPEDVKVVGFDDTFVAPIIDPSLTSIHVPGTAMAQAAMNMAIARILDDTLPSAQQMVPTELVVRRSTDITACLPKTFVNW